MNRHVNAIAGRFSLRPPQRESLEILDRVMEIAPPGKDQDLAAALEAIRSEFPTVTDFERDFPSLCFALATGVGKTRLMGAFITYLHLAHSIDNFFVLAPSLTIYNKLIADFTPNTPKYVFRASRSSRLPRRKSSRATTTSRADCCSKISPGARSTSSTSRRSTRKYGAERVPESNGSPSSSGKATSSIWRDWTTWSS